MELKENVKSNVIVGLFSSLRSSQLFWIFSTFLGFILMVARLSICAGSLAVLPSGRMAG